MASEAIIHIIDDDEAVRESLAFLLHRLHPVRTYESAIAFLNASPRERSGCIITDLRMPEVDGLELLRRLKNLNLNLPVIVITGHGDVPLAVEAMKIGAFDFLEKPFDDEALLAKVELAFNNSNHYNEQAAEREDIVGKLATLSNRERQVLERLILGHQNKRIAFDLGISPRTVETYRATVMTKMQAKNLSELVRKGLIARGI